MFTRTTRLALTAVASAAVPLALMLPANASTSSSLCTVTPKAPVFRVTSNGVTSPWTAWENSNVVSFHL
jgi:hypothetical protein